MKSVATPMLAIAIASMLVACTPPEGAQDTAVVPAQTAEPPPVVETAPPPPSTPVLPPLRALTEAEHAQALAPATNCNLESIDGQAFVGTDIALATLSALKATGWLRADRAGSVIEQPALRFESEDKARLWEVPIQTSIARDDLPAAATDGGLPGFELTFDASTLSSGRYHLYLAYKVDGAWSGCDNGRHITIP
jgi:hypothetical protein